MVMWSPDTRSPNLYGPVPTGWVTTAAVFGATVTDAGEMIAVLVWLSAAANGASGVLSVNLTWLSSTTATLAMPVLPPRMPGWDRNVLGLSSRSMLNLTAAALNGVPSENLIPWRRVNVQLSPSLEGSHFVARRGWSTPLSLTVVSVSA